LNSVITFISDYGIGSPYTASIQGWAQTLMPDAKVFELSHHIPSHDLVQTAFILKSVYASFPKGACHIICVDSNITLHQQALFVEHDGHFFVGADNGVFSMLFDTLPTKVYKILHNAATEYSSFPEKNVFLPMVVQFLRTGDLKGLAEPSAITNIKTSIQPTIEANSLSGTVMFVDGFQNAMTNIHRTLFEKEKGDQNFRFYYWGKHFIDAISVNFHEGKPGEDVLLYNENGYLTIGINRGKSAQLHGLKVGSKIVIDFEKKEEN